MDDKRVVVLVSGHGSNLQALLDAAAERGSGMTVVLVGADRPGAFGLERARRAGVDTAVVRPADHPDRASFDLALRDLVAAARPDVVCLAGFMRILGPAFVGAFPDRILNTHPSLLPAFRGAHAVRDALAYGVKVTGCTVHLVDEQVDHGPVLFQAAVPVEPGDDEDRLHGADQAGGAPPPPPGRPPGRRGPGPGRGPPRPDRGGRGGSPVTTRLPIRRALVSVSEKRGLTAWPPPWPPPGSRLLTGSTSAAFGCHGLAVTRVEEQTRSPERWTAGSRPSTRGSTPAPGRPLPPGHQAELDEAGIAAHRPGGGQPLPVRRRRSLAPTSTLARRSRASTSAARHVPRGGQESRLRHGRVDPGDYAVMLEELRARRRRSARRAWPPRCSRTPPPTTPPSAAGLGRGEADGVSALSRRLELRRTLRYGENPHQTGAFYTERRAGRSARARGVGSGSKELTFNNLVDVEAASAVREFANRPSARQAHQPVRGGVAHRWTSPTPALTPTP